MAIPITNASLPLSMQRARGDFSASGAFRSSDAVAPDWVSYEPPDESGILAFGMQDLLYNWLLDLVLVENPGVSHIFLSALMAAAADPDITFQYNEPVAIGTRSIPENDIDVFQGMEQMDFGTVVIRENPDVDGEILVFWTLSVDFGEEIGLLPAYLHLTITGSADAMTTQKRALVAPDSPEPMFFYEEFGSGGLWVSYNLGQGENNVFQQYTDSAGYLRTLFSADIARPPLDGDEGPDQYYQLLMMMVGNDDGSALYKFDRSEADRTEPILADTEALRTFESYNSQGQLVEEETQPSEGTTSFRYPLKTMVREGYTLQYDSASNQAAWLATSNGDPVSITGTVVTANEYQRWVEEKTFNSLPDEKLLQRDARLESSLLDSSAGTAALQSILDTWMEELQEEHGINGTTNILTFNPDLDILVNDLGRNLITDAIAAGLFPEQAQ